MTAPSTDPAAPQAGTTDQPQAGTPTPPSGDPQQPQAGSANPQPLSAGTEPAPEDESISLAEARRLRAENAGYRTKLKTFEEADQQRQREAMTADEKLKADQTALAADRQAFAQQQREFTARQAVASESAKKGLLISADRVFALVASEIEYDAAGKPTNVESVLTALVASEPKLVGAVNGNPTNPQRAGGKAMTKEEAARLSAENPAEFNRLFEAKDPALLEALRG